MTKLGIEPAIHYSHVLYATDCALGLCSSIKKYYASHMVHCSYCSAHLFQLLDVMMPTMAFQLELKKKKKKKKKLSKYQSLSVLMDQHQ